MRVTDQSRRALAFRRQARELKRAGFDYVEPRELSNARYRERILEVRISTDGKRIYYRAGEVVRRVTASLGDKEVFAHFKGSFR